MMMKPVLFLLINMLSFSTFAETKYYFPGPHLPPPPAKTSDAYREDFTILHTYQDHRSPEECASADEQSYLTLENGFGPATGVLTAEEVNKAKIPSKVILASAGAASFYFKNKYKRPRPYNTDLTLTPCIHKPRDYAYPSGHATAGYALALVLVKIFPDKKEIILKQGLKIGENRLIGGVHHPSDVKAGQDLARQLVKFLQ